MAIKVMSPQSPTQGAMSILETHLCTPCSLTETHFKRRTVKCQAEVVRRASSLPWMPGDPQKDSVSLEREFLAESLLSTVLKFLDFKMRWHLLNPIMYSCGPDCFQANRTIYKSFIQRGQEPDLKRTFSGSSQQGAGPKPTGS